MHKNIHLHIAGERKIIISEKDDFFGPKRRLAMTEFGQLV
jgi:hypothetical protein